MTFGYTSLSVPLGGLWVNSVDDVLTKSVRNGTVNIDKAQGIVECFVAAIGNKDSVGDIIIPGAFTKSLGRRKPRVVWGHNWNEPVGKVLDMYEVGPSDPRLPPKMRETGVAGLFAKVQFNLNSERGREAFASVAFFGEDQEWSIGYKTIDKEYDVARQANILKEVELYEVSPVLHGANQLTGTVSVKAADYEPGADCPSNVLTRALSTAFGRPVSVQYVDGDSIVFEDEENKQWSSKFFFSDGRFSFARPRRVMLRAIIEPIEEEPEEPLASLPISPTTPPHNCECGLHLPKAVDPTEMSFKTGRVLNTVNVGKLQQALNLLQEVLSSGIPQEEEVGVERKFGAKEYADYALHGKGKAFVVGRPETLSGITLEVKTETPESAGAVVEALTDMLDSVAVAVPTVRGFEDGLNRTVVYLQKVENPQQYIEAVADALSRAGDELAVETKRLDFPKTGKPFEEVFPSK